MRKELMELLACPLCRGLLRLTVEREEGVEIVKGSMRCAKCGETYPIEDSVPNLLPPALRV